MPSIRLLSALAAATLLSMVSADDSSSSSKIVSIPTPTATLPAAAMETMGCFSTGVPLEDHGKGYFMSPGSCQQICLGLGKDVLGLSEGTNCWCGDKFPPKKSITDNSTCDTPCSGTKEVLCGGPSVLWVMTTGNTLNRIEYFEPEDVSSSASSKKPAAQTSAAVSTIVETASSTPSKAPESSGPNKAGIAAGVVVGVVALCAIIGGVFFYLRQRRRREVEEEYRRQAAVNSFVAGGKLHTSNSSMTDSRLDPEFMNRRQSNGSIADNEDYSRRILKVTNA